MSTDEFTIQIRGISVHVVRKAIKNLHVGVYPPGGRVRVAAPLSLDQETIRMAVISRLGWIRKRKKAFEKQERQSQREMITGESHFFQGNRYLLDVIEHDAPPRVFIRNSRTMELRIRSGADRDKRESILYEWYREQLRKIIPGLIAKWEPKIGVEVADWGIRKMKTKWGSCNVNARRIWVNLELAKNRLPCLEYVVVHEMLHLRERHHNDRFKELMGKLIPQWQLLLDELNGSVLGHEEWDSHVKGESND